MNNRAISFLTVAVVLILMIGAISILFVRRGSLDSDTSDVLSFSGKDDILNMLILGRDSAAGLCDVIMLASVNFAKNEVNVMQIPRDTYFNYTENDYKKINGALNAYDSSAAFSRALEDALGIDIDYYFTLRLDVVEKMVDAVSGIEIEVPVDMDYEDPSQGLSIHLKAGKQSLDGKDAVQFLRYRSGYVTGDLGRMDAQKLFINAFAKKLSEDKNPAVYYSLTRLLIKDAETNFTEKDLVGLILKCKKDKPSSNYYMTAPGEAVQSEISGAWYYIVSRPALYELLKDRFGSKYSENDFDKSNKLVDNRVKSFYDIYNKRCEYKIYSAIDADNNLININ